MALARVKSPNPGDAILAADYNAEFNNILNNPIALVSPTTGTINFNLQGHTNFRSENLSVDPTTTSTGRLFYNTARNYLGVDDASGLIRAAPMMLTTAMAAGDLIQISSSGTGYSRLGMGTSGQVLTAATSGMAAWAALPIANTSGIGTYKIKGLIGTINDNSLLSTWAAQNYVVWVSSGRTTALILSTDAFGVNISTSVAAGVGSRDVGTSFGSGQWVHWYVVSTGINSTTPAGVASLTAPPTGPTLPTSYVGWAYMGPSYLSTGANGSAANTFVAQNISGPWFYNVRTSFQRVVSSGTSLTVVPTTASTFIPPTAEEIIAAIVFGSTIGGESWRRVALYVSSSDVSDTETIADFTAPGSTSLALPGTIKSHFPIPQKNQTVVYNVILGTGAIHVDIKGYRVPAV